MKLSVFRSGVTYGGSRVNLKLGFMDWFFYNLITLIKCKIPNKDVDKESSIVFEKQGILSGKIKLDEL